MFNQQGYGGYNDPYQQPGGYYNAGADNYNKGTYYGNQPNDRYYTYGQQQQGGYNYGRGNQSG